MFFNIIILFMLASAVNGINKPTRIRATKVRSTSFTITWNTQPYTCYKISVKTDSQSVTNPTNAEYVDTPFKVNKTTSSMTLQPNQPYYITLFAINPSDSTDYNYASYDVTTEPGSPTLPVLSQPTGPTADPSTMIKVDWNKPDGGDNIDNYRVAWKLSTESSYSSSPAIAHVVGTTSYSYIINNLIPGGSYNVRVIAHNSAGYGGYSSTATYVTIPGKPPKPTLRQFTTYQPTTTLYMSWSQTTGNVEKYEVKIYLGSTPVIQHSTTGNHFFFYNLEAGAAYSATVTYITGGSRGIESEKSDQARTNPPTPTNVTINKPLIGDETTQVNVTWNMPSSLFRVASYEIVVKPSNGSNIKIQYNTGSNNPSTTYMVDNLVPGESYTATIQAISPSAGAPATFSETPSTSNIYNTKPSQVNYKVVVAAHEVKLTWNHSDGYFDGFRVQLFSQKIDNKARELLEDIKNLNTSITSYTFQGLNQSTEYKIKMSSWVNGNSGRLYSIPTVSQYSTAPQDGSKNNNNKSESETGLIVGLVISFLALFFFILGIIVYHKKRRKMENMNDKSENHSRGDVITVSNQNEAFDENTNRIQDSNPAAVIDKSSAKPSVKPKTRARIVLLSKFNENMKLLRAIDHRPLNEEFKELKEVGRKEKHDVALKPENLKKNRYKKNIFPYDTTRVELNTIEAEPGSDYINANFVPGYNDEKEFIATQGPLPCTKDDFWRMIWEQNSRNIVMLTQIVEDGRLKCIKYWPDSETPFSVSNMCLQLTNETKSKHWTLRKFNLNKDGESRVIHQFHYTAWPDNGVPDIIADFIKFFQYFRENIIKEVNHTGPITVHCSAGVGRTGTFIATDHLFQRMKEHSDVNIYGIVHEMRKHRMLLVQTKEQYILLYKVVEEWIKHNYEETSPVYENTTTLGSLYGNI